MTRRACSILIVPLMLAALACNLPGVGQQPAVTETAIVAASSTAFAAATANALYTSIAQTQIALVPTATLTASAISTEAATEVATSAVTSVTGTPAAANAAAAGTATQTSIANGTLKVGIEALVQASSGGVLNMRDLPGKSAKVTARIPGDTRVKIIDGPKAADGLLWWKVQVITSSSSAVGQSGWCAEFDGKVQTLQAAK